jgi:multiple sugar transport system permease protein
VAILILFAGMFLLPFLWNVSSALKPSEEILQYPPTFVPEEPTAHQLERVVTAGNGVFLTYLKNTLIMCGAAIAVVLVVSVLSSYAFAALPFKGSNLIFIVILSILMVPFQALLIPLYNLLSNLGLLDTKTGLVLVYSTFFMPFCVFMMRNYFASLPTSLRESAVIDGASELRILLGVYLPLSLPAVATVVVFVFLETWNDFILSLIFSSSNNAKNIQVGIMNFGTARYQNDWGIINAGSAMSVVAPVVLFLLLQRYYVRGLTSGFGK